MNDVGMAPGRVAGVLDDGCRCVAMVHARGGFVDESGCVVRGGPQAECVEGRAKGRHCRLCLGENEDVGRVEWVCG